MTVRIDLNADLGEGMAFDDALLDIVSSASIACGGHAGSPELMRKTLAAARERGVATGAHPGFADPEHFGRRQLDPPMAEIVRQVIGQVEAITRISGEIGQPIAYLKLHGALYNMAGRDIDLAGSIFEAIRQRFGALPVMALDNSAQVEAATMLGLPVIREAFADRAYTAAGHLMPRTEDGAVLADPEAACAQAVSIARDKLIVAADGSVIETSARSLCLHGDNAQALKLARAVRTGLEREGIMIRPAV